MRVVEKPSAGEWTHLTVRECAARWKISERTIFAKIADDEIDIVKFGRATRIPRDEVERIDNEGFSPAEG